MIKKRSNGVWRLDVKLPNGERCRKSLGTKDKAEALLKAPKVLQEIISAFENKPLEPAPVVKTKAKTKTLTLRNAFKQAFRDHPKWRDSKSPKTIEDNFDLICRSGYFSQDDDLTSITYARASEYVEALREDETSPSTINQRLSLLSVLITLGATIWGYKELTPFKMPRVKPNKGRMRIVSRDEEAKVIALFSKNIKKYHEDMADLVPCLVDTGCRLSEMLRLQVRDISWEQNLVMIWENKADQPRGVPMTKRVAAILKKREYLERPFKMLTVYSAAECWQWVRKEMRLSSDKEFVIHSLRHTTASRLAAAGMDAFRIQKWMGHKNIATTMIYVNLFANDLQALTTVLEPKERSKPSGAIEVPKSVPKQVEWLVDTAGERTVPSYGPRLDSGLLIRWSLVRAQHGLPDLEGLPKGCPSTSPPDSPQVCQESVPSGPSHQSISDQNEG